MLKKFGFQIPGAEGVLEEELAKVTKKKRVGEDTPEKAKGTDKGTSKSPEKARSAESTPKKRKLGPPVKLDVEELGDC